MGRSLPQEWIDGTLHTLNVVRDLGGKGNIPHTSLSIVRQKPSANSRKTKNLQWRFLPEKADDPRPFAGKTNRGRGKRIYIEGTCGTTDPWEAAKVAVAASQKKWQDLLSQSQVREVEKQHALSVYWERWYAKAELEPRNNRSRWLSDKRNLWNGTTGIGVQPWATVKSIQRSRATTFWSSSVSSGRTVKRRATQEKRPEGNTRPLSATCSKRRRQISPLCHALSSLR